ncbi:hypothetical protein Dimus_020372 [Dionaea muscipula]
MLRMKRSQARKQRQNPKAKLRPSQGPSLAPRRAQAEGRAPPLDDELIFIVSMYHRRARASSRTPGKTDLRPCMVSEAELGLCRTPSLYQAWQRQMGMRRKTIPNSENTPINQARGNRAPHPFANSSPSMKEAKQAEHGVPPIEVEPKAYG